MTAPLWRRWAPGREVDLHSTVGSLSRGATDPSHRVAGDGSYWRATRTPDGPATLRLLVRPTEGRVLAAAWGPGAAWVLDGVPDLLGEADRESHAFRPLPCHPMLARAAQRFPHWRVPRSRAVFEALAMAALEQVVTGLEARRSLRTLVRRYGETAPGPPPPPTAAGHRAPLVVPPSPDTWARIPTWEWLRAGVEQRRSATVVRAARSASQLEATLLRPLSEVAGALRVLPGVGRWTAAEVAQRAHGDPDAFSFDDYHVAKNVSWALTGEILDDDGCAEVIACYAGHRYRVQRLLELCGVARPRFGPRMTLPTHVPAATAGRS